MSKKKIYEETCSKVISTKITEKQYVKLASVQLEKKLNTTGYVIRFLIDNYVSSNGVVVSISASEKKPTEAPPPRKIFSDPQEKLTQEELQSRYYH